MTAMSEVAMPDGEYFSLSGMIRAGTGGQTRALLMRNRLLTQHGGVPTTLLTFDSAPVYPEVRAKLSAMGQLVDGMRMVNFYEFFRIEDLSDVAVTGATLEDLGSLQARQELHPDGSVYRTDHLDPATEDVLAQDYHRPDGTRYLRIPTPKGAQQRSFVSSMLNAQEQVIQRQTKVGGLYRFWIRRLTPAGRRAFIISDSRFALAHILPFRSDRFHVMHLMHNAHTVGQRHWNSTLAGAYAPLLDNIALLDGLVTLTHRQREDVIARYGQTNNLFVVPGRDPCSPGGSAGA